MKRLTLSCFLALYSVLLTGNAARVQAFEDQCPAAISTLQQQIAFPEEWFLSWAPDNPQEISRSGSVGVSIIASDPNFTWKISGGDFWFDANHTQTVISDTASKTVSVYAGPNACGAATITVTDSVQRSITGHVRCINGSNWYRVNSASCPIPGPATTTWIDPMCNTWRLERIHGKFYVYQIYDIVWAFYGTCPGRRFEDSYPYTTGCHQCITFSCPPCGWSQGSAWNSCTADGYSCPDGTYSSIRGYCDTTFILYEWRCN